MKFTDKLKKAIRTPKSESLFVLNSNDIVKEGDVITTDEGEEFEVNKDYIGHKISYVRNLYEYEGKRVSGICRWREEE